MLHLNISKTALDAMAVLDIGIFVDPMMAKMITSQSCVILSIPIPFSFS
jgi:hypothetical protein